MRRTYQFGSYQYDPGKYDTAKKEELTTKKMRKEHGRKDGKRGMDKSDTSIVDEEDDESGPADSWEDDEYEEENDNNEEELQQQSKDMKQAASSSNKGNGSKGGMFIIDDGEITRFTTEEDEIDAPWNQYAWIEEMQLRIKGQIPFSAPVEQSSFLSRSVFGNSYRSIIPSSRGYVSWLWPSFLSWNRVGDDGIDGDYDADNGRGYYFFRRKGTTSSTSSRNNQRLNRASNKPHAVIANGLAMQRVPGSLRFLTKCCREADVPLFIINDPRAWGGNTHTDLESAVEDMRKTIKTRIVVKALNIKEGSAFERGRLLGKIETETKWQAKDAARATRQRLMELREKMKRKNQDDWSDFSDEELMDKLADRKVIGVEKHSTGGTNSKDDGSSSVAVTNVVEVRDNMMKVCHECLKHDESNLKEEDGKKVDAEMQHSEDEGSSSSGFDETVDVTSSVGKI